MVKYTDIFVGFYDTCNVECSLNLRAIFSEWMQLYKVVSSWIISYQDKTIKHSIFERGELKRILTPRKKSRRNLILNVEVEEMH